MSNPFVAPKKLVEVDLKYLIYNDDLIVIKDETNMKKEFKKDLKIAKASFAYEKWQDFNSTMKNSMRSDNMAGIPMVDTVLLREIKLKKLLKKLVDGDGNEIELSDEFFKNMNPDFAISLMDAYSDRLFSILPEIFEVNDEEVSVDAEDLYSLDKIENKNENDE